MRDFLRKDPRAAQEMYVMQFKTWWRRFFNIARQTPIRRKIPGQSTRLMEVEVLEDRLTPASIYVTAALETLTTRPSTAPCPPALGGGV